MNNALNKVIIDFDCIIEKIVFLDNNGNYLDINNYIGRKLLKAEDNILYFEVGAGL